MFRTAVLAGLVTVFAMPAFSGQTQLARAAGVEPGLYSTNQLVQILALQSESGSSSAIQRILDNPQGGPLVGRLSTTTLGDTTR